MARLFSIQFHRSAACVCPIPWDPTKLVIQSTYHVNVQLLHDRDLRTPKPRLELPPLYIEISATLS